MVSWLISAMVSAILGGCSSFSKSPLGRTISPPDVKIMSYHYRANLTLLRDMMQRLYRKNPCYEPDQRSRMEKMDFLFNPGYSARQARWYQNLSAIEDMGCPVLTLPSHRLLDMAFSPEPCYHDRIFLLIMGLKKSLDEAYSVTDGVFVTGCQIPVEQLQRLYHNFQVAKWRLKSRRFPDGTPVFYANEAGRGGYINMGYEVIFTTILTRIADDIYLRSGLEGHFAIRLGASFMAIL